MTFYYSDLIILLLLIISTFALWLLRRHAFKKKLKEFLDYRYEFLTLPKRSVDDLAQVGKEYKKVSVEHVILIHGTFAGDDPFLMGRALANKTPLLLHPLLRIYRNISKRTFDFVGRDLGNFTTGHKNLLEQHLKQKVSLFNWSGANNHYGRYHGTVELIDYLAKQKSRNYLIISHSHGGQLLALLSQLFGNQSALAQLRKQNLISQKTLNQIDQIKKHQYYFVTMGTPVRYLWQKNQNIDLLHIINHRGKVPIGGGALGMLWNRKGDYIQQFGGAGSDYFPIVDLHREENKKLESIFREENLGIWGLVKRRQRLHHLGINLLVDYRDAKLYPNFHKTIFGHGIYTRYHLIAFHLKIIKKYLL